MPSQTQRPRSRRTTLFGLAVLAGLLLGALLGFVAKQGEVSWLATTLSRIGEVFVSLVQFTVIPLVFTAIVVGITSLRALGGARTAVRGGGGQHRRAHTGRLVVVHHEHRAHQRVQRVQ